MGPTGSEKGLTKLLNGGQHRCNLDSSVEGELMSTMIYWPIWGVVGIIYWTGIR